VDAVVSNPPYSQQWDPSGKETDPRYARFGLAPKGKADYAFLLHDLFHIKPDGIITIVLPHGVLFRGGEEGEIRKNLIENNHIDTIIGLPANIFFGTGIPTIIMVLKQKRSNTDVLIIDASKGSIKEGKNNKLRASDIKRIADTVVKREKGTEKYSKLVARDEIRQNDYNLNIPRYVDSSESAESWDIYATMFGGIPKSEIDGLKNFWTAFPGLKSALFTDSDTPYVELRADDIKSVIKGHGDVIAFEEAYRAAFESFPVYMKERLIGNMETISISKAESEFSEDIFNRLNGIPLVDKYDAFQLLDDEWTKISIDLEIIRTEGFNAIKKVDPNLVLKKKEGKEQEIQEGWVGRIIPFELVQSTLLKEDYDLLKVKECELSETSSEHETIIDSITEEEKELCKDVFNDEGNVFVSKGILDAIKQLKGDNSVEAAEYLIKIEQINELIKQEKNLKAQIKTMNAELQARTKDTIEQLTDDKAVDLIEKKWIDTLILRLNEIPDTIIDSFVASISALKQKYETTYYDIEQQIRDT